MWLPKYSRIWNQFSDVTYSTPIMLSSTRPCSSTVSAYYGVLVETEETTDITEVNGVKKWVWVDRSLRSRRWNQRSLGWPRPLTLCCPGLRGLRLGCISSCSWWSINIKLGAIVFTSPWTPLLITSWWTIGLLWHLYGVGKLSYNLWQAISESDFLSICSPAVPRAEK